MLISNRAFHRLICQYCGFSSKFRFSCLTITYVNSNHELTTWFKCDECDYTTLVGSKLQTHLKNRHIRRNVNKDKIEKLLVKDQKEIDELKKNWTGKKQAQKRDNEKFSKLSQDQRPREIGNHEDCFQSQSDDGISTRDIKKEEMLLKIDENEMEYEYSWENKDSDEYNKDALDELDEEWLTGPSW